MTLLRQMQAAFPEERVMLQARLSWLAPQSLDIYLPDCSIGVEYQRAQHSGPVEFFGGIKGTRTAAGAGRPEMDLCRHHGCVLIEVHRDHQLEQVIAQVKDAMPMAGWQPGGPRSRQSAVR